ncbi:hypothetical protein [Vibrio parahaemolyticus]|uniref:hypothetical protein n=1 Tax=Vibrio parahaemolyticus TaxID=670 RepID=UPI00226985E4|nr:hypothetical protein [Vibrio parahaemolyticus]MCX8796442.1 hypothetical protein [Vibrio parahaemolyticus]
MSAIKIIEDDNYGQYKHEFIANLDYDFLRLNLSFSELDKWSSKFNPNKYFYSYSTVKVRNELSEYIESRGFVSENVDLYVCIDDINKDWDSAFWREKHDISGKKCSLPVAISRKKVDKWLFVYNKLLKLAKKYTQEGMIENE